MKRVFLDYRALSELLSNSLVSSFPERDALLILLPSVLGLTRQEISGLKIKDIIKSNGELKGSLQVDVNYAYKGVARTIPVSSNMHGYFSQYVEWLKGAGLDVGDDEYYRGFDPDFIFIRNDLKEPYSLLVRSHSRAEGLSSYHTRALDDKYTALLQGTPYSTATPSVFRDSFILNAYREGVSINDLMSLTGIKSRAALKRKIENYAVSSQDVSEFMLNKLSNE